MNREKIHSLTTRSDVLFKLYHNQYKHNSEKFYEDYIKDLTKP